jgi:hypothetical protein
MESRSCYRVVRSSGVLFMQHASTHWAVEGDGFVTLDEINPEATIIVDTLNSWSESYEPDKRALFIDAAYDVIRATDVDTLSEFGANKSDSILAVVEATTQIPADMRSTLLRMVRDIAPILSETTKRTLSRR